MRFRAVIEFYSLRSSKKLNKITNKIKTEYLGF